MPNNRIDGYSYDAAGNLLNDTLHSYAYDAENRIVAVDAATTYGYDAQDRRVSKTAGGSVTAFIYHPEGHMTSAFLSSRQGRKRATPSMRRR